LKKGPTPLLMFRCIAKSAPKLRIIPLGIHILPPESGFSHRPFSEK